jgi:perosamine synthetase
MRSISLARPLLNGHESKYVQECIKTTWISSQGKFVDKFEKAFANYCQVKYGVACCNGTVALHLALSALNIGPDDEVLVPDLTFIAPVNAIIYTGAKPVLVDIDKKTWNIDPEKIEKLINKKTKAIILVHLYGYPCEMKSILKITKKYKLFVIEDCAEAIGAVYNGQRVGSFGDVSCFSFYGNKVITTGEGGMCLTNDKKIADKIRILSNHGAEKKIRYWYKRVGYNYRLTNLQAAVGLAQLEKIGNFLKIRKKIFRSYNNLLAKIDGIVLPPAGGLAKPVCWLYSILLDKKYNNISRDRLIEKLSKRKIDSRPLFYSVHRMPPYKKYCKKGQLFPVASDISSRGLSLPTNYYLTLDQIKYVVKNIKDILNG